MTLAVIYGFGVTFMGKFHFEWPSVISEFCTALCQHFSQTEILLRVDICLVLWFCYFWFRPDICSMYSLGNTTMVIQKKSEDLLLANVKMESGCKDCMKKWEGVELVLLLFVNWRLLSAIKNYLLCERCSLGED